MVERRQIVQLWSNRSAEVLVTLVRVEGSSYRQPGARLLTTNAGAYAGTVSGGCLEADIVRKARWMVREGAMLERYSMAFDDTADIPFGLGCGGTVDLLLEPADTPESEALFAAMQASLDGHPSTVVSFLPGEGRGLRRLILDEGGSLVFASSALSEEKIACARRLTPGQAYEGRFVERLSAPQRLFVLGAGDDAKPLVRLAALLGWNTLVADGRSQLAKAERFPEAHEVIVAASAVALGVGEKDAVVLMTHSYEQDRDLLISALPLGPRYLGLLGSRHRSSLLLSEAASALGFSLEECCAAVCAPVGMDLGGDGPEAIALSIVSEIQALCHGRSGPSRRLTAHEVLEQVRLGGTARYLEAECGLGA